MRQGRLRKVRAMTVKIARVSQEMRDISEGKLFLIFRMSTGVADEVASLRELRLACGEGVRRDEGLSVCSDSSGRLSCDDHVRVGGANELTAACAIFSSASVMAARFFLGEEAIEEGH